MQLNHGLHLAYCTNVHPGKNWAQTMHSLEHYTLAVKQKVCPDQPYAIGLRLSDQAARALMDPATLRAFQHWLERHHCYVFTINGFPFGQFHGARVKEQVYWPDWTTPERLAYTNRLFELLAQLVPPQVEGSVSTLPGSFKEFIHTPEQTNQIQNNLWQCVEHIARISQQTGRPLHLGLEPEPFGWIENTAETVRFFEALREQHPGDARLAQHLGVNYDTCHFAVEHEEATEALTTFQQHSIRVSKIHLSNALKVQSSPAALAQLAAFTEDIYLHQVIIRDETGALVRFKDLDLALASPLGKAPTLNQEWRVHFHVPLHSKPPASLDTTEDHVLGVLRFLQRQPRLCSHLEMETYTWAVLPEPLKTRDVTEQIVGEYTWTLQRLSELGLSGKGPSAHAS